MVVISRRPRPWAASARDHGGEGFRRSGAGPGFPGAFWISKRFRNVLARSVASFRQAHKVRGGTRLIARPLQEMAGTGGQGRDFLPVRIADSQRPWLVSREPGPGKRVSFRRVPSKGQRKRLPGHRRKRGSGPGLARTSVTGALCQTFRRLLRSLIPGCSSKPCALSARATSPAACRRI